MERDRRGEREGGEREGKEGGRGRKERGGEERRGKRGEREREHKNTRSKGSPWAILNLGSRLKRYSQGFGRKIHID